MIVTIVVYNRKENFAISKKIPQQMLLHSGKGGGLWVIVVKVNVLCVYFIVGSLPVSKDYNWTHITHSKSMWTKFL